MMWRTKVHGLLSAIAASRWPCFSCADPGVCGVRQSAYSYDSLGRELSAAPGSGGTGPSNNLSYSGAGNDIAADSATSYALDPAGNPVASRNPGGASLTLSDQHADVVGAFTATGAALTASAAYDPLGGSTGHAGTMPGLIGYQSGWTDPVTGQVDMWHRRYDHNSGLFDSRDSADLSPDPASVVANRFAYANNNPLGTTDPTGYAGMICTCAPLGGITPVKVTTPIGEKVQSWLQSHAGSSVEDEFDSLYSATQYYQNHLAGRGYTLSQIENKLRQRGATLEAKNEAAARKRAQEAETAAQQTWLNELNNTHEDSGPPPPATVTPPALSQNDYIALRTEMLYEQYKNSSQYVGYSDATLKQYAYQQAFGEANNQVSLGQVLEAAGFILTLPTGGEGIALGAAEELATDFGDQTLVHESETEAADEAENEAAAKALDSTPAGRPYSAHY